MHRTSVSITDFSTGTGAGVSTEGCPGLVVQGRNAQWRPCRLEPTPLQDVSSWVEQYRRLWEARLDRLDQYLRDLQTREATGDHAEP